MGPFPQMQIIWKRQLIKITVQNRCACACLINNFTVIILSVVTLSVRVTLLLLRLFGNAKTLFCQQRTELSFMSRQERARRLRVVQFLLSDLFAVQFILFFSGSAGPNKLESTSLLCFLNRFLERQLSPYNDNIDSQMASKQPSYKNVTSKQVRYTVPLYFKKSILITLSNKEEVKYFTVTES